MRQLPGLMDDVSNSPPVCGRRGDPGDCGVDTRLGSQLLRDPDLPGESMSSR